MSVLDLKITYFKSTKLIEAINNEQSTIGFWLKCIKDGKFKEKVENYRNTKDKLIKQSLPTIAFHGSFSNTRSKNNFDEATGVIILDIDNLDTEQYGIEEIKEQIFYNDDSVLSVFVSPGGEGLKVLYLVEQSIVNQNNYRKIGKQIVDDFSAYGDVDYLSVTDCLIISYDENILVNEHAYPKYVYVKEEQIKETELEEIDKSKDLWEDCEDFYDTVLVEEIKERANNNFHFIQMSVLELAKFGFFHPKQDLSFVIDYSENFFGSNSVNKTRFREVTEIAKNNYKQTKHPYKTFVSEQVEEEVEWSKEYLEEDTKEEEEEPLDHTLKFENVWSVIQEGDRVGKEISLSNFADVFRFKGTGILTITGIPTHGKTEFLDQCIVDLARLHQEESYIVGFEQTPEEQSIKQARRMIGKDIRSKSWQAIDNNKDVLSKNIDFISKHITHYNIKNGSNVVNILKAAAEWIKRRTEQGGNPRYLVIDPFNMLSIKGRFSSHEKVEEILRTLTQFSHQMGVMVILVAHPFKMRKDEATGEYQIPDFYSVKGSSAFYEMSYHGLVVYRKPDSVLVRVLKVKQNNLGDIGADCYFRYNKNNGRYFPIDEEQNEIAGDYLEPNWVNKVEFEY